MRASKEVGDPWMSDPGVDEQGFEAELVVGGFAVFRKSVPAGSVIPDHVHDRDALALVTAGSITITMDGESRTYGKGDRFVMASGQLHAERIGPDGVCYITGRR